MGKLGNQYKTPKMKSGTKEPIVATMAVEKTVSGKPAGKVDDESELGYVVTQEQPAIVTRRDRFTKNMGNFESVSVEIGISMPCDPTKVDEAYKEAVDWVTERMKTVLEEVNSVKAKSPGLLTGEKKVKDFF